MESVLVVDDDLVAMRQQNIGRLFQQAHRAFSRQAVHKLRARGHAGLTLAHSLLLSNLDLDGTRITVLAGRAGITKQSMGQLVLDLEGHGYIARQPDPLDRRATSIRFTDLGRQFLRDAYAIKQEIEAEYTAILGAEGLQQLRAALQQIQQGSAPDSAESAALPEG